jgi:MFS family permease
MALFVLAFCIILSMYGGGFATVPAYLADMFGSQMVGAIHGRLLTAWATAGVLGPLLITYIREYQIAQGVPKAHAYDVTMYILAGLLVLGFVCNSMINPVEPENFMSDEELALERKLAHDRSVTVTDNGVAPVASVSSHPVLLIAGWAAVGIPMLAGIWITFQKAIVLFK